LVRNRSNKIDTRCNKLGFVLDYFFSGLALATPRHACGAGVAVGG